MGNASASEVTKVTSASLLQISVMSRDLVRSSVIAAHHRRGPGGQSAKGWQADDGIIAQGCDGLQGHVTSRAVSPARSASARARFSASGRRTGCSHTAFAPSIRPSPKIEDIVSFTTIPLFRSTMGTLDYVQVRTDLPAFLATQSITKRKSSNNGVAFTTLSYNRNVKKRARELCP